MPPPWLTLRFDIEHEETARYLGTDECVGREVDDALSLLAEAEAAGNFAIVASTARRFPDAVRRIAAAGHGILGHGNAHEAMSGWDRARQAASLEAMRKTLEEIAGESVPGFAAPHDSANADTAAAALDAGLRYATYAPGAARAPLPSPVRIAGHEKPLWVMSPPNQPRNGRSDWSILRKDPPWSEPAWDEAAARKDWLGALESAAARRGILNLVAHPWMFGTNTGERDLLLEILRKAKAAGRRASTFGEILSTLEPAADGQDAIT